MLWSIPLLPLLLAPLLYWRRRRAGRAALAAGAALILLIDLVLAGLALAGLGRLGGWSDGAFSVYRWSDTLVLTLGRSTASDVFMVMVPLVALPIALFATWHDVALRDDRRTADAAGSRLLALLVAFVGAMQLLVLANDLLTLLIAWELVGACSWALISHKWGEADVGRDAAQAFLVTRSGDLGLYIAAAAVFAGTGGFGYADLAALDGPLLHVAVAGILLATAAKSAQLPFSAWLFAAMSGPVPVSALLHAATMVAAGIYLLVRLEPTLSTVAWFMPTVIGIGLVTALAAGVVGTFQGHAKKLLAASTSAQYGLMWVAVGAGFPGVALLHFVAHAFMKAGLFLSTGLAEHRSGSYRLDGMRLGRCLPGVAATTLILSLALAGMIPLGAAWTKEQIVSAAGVHGTWLALLAALAGGLSALYATRFQRLAYGRGERRGKSRSSGAVRPSQAELGALRLLAAGTLGLSVLWWPAANRAVSDWLVMQRPPGHLWMLFVSLALVLLGIVAGIVMTRQGRPAEPVGWRRPVADWFGLPALTLSVAANVTRLSGVLARFDNDVVDAGLRGTARIGQRLARFNATHGEALSEGVPGGFSYLAERGGHWARRAQSGQTHHYYAAIAAGLAIVLAILMIGVLW